MRIRLPQFRSKWVGLAALVVALGLAWVFSDAWLPATGDRAESPDGTSSDEHAGHDHGHAGHDEASSLELSEEARRNLGLKIGRVSLATYEKTISVPAMVVERPGRTMVRVVAPMTGRVSEIYAVRGESVRPGQPLFKIRLTHEDLVEAQTQFLKALEERDVENREIARLERVSERGVIAGKTVLERQYARDKLEAVLRAQRQALLLHGLSAEQISQIEDKRTLVRELAVVAPPLPNGHSSQRRASSGRIAAVSLPPGPSPSLAALPDVLAVDQLNVHQGEFVRAGQSLATLADFTQLYVEGRAFEQDANALIRAAEQDWEVTAVFADRAGDPQTIPGLEIVYVSNDVDPETRAFYFYIELPNTPVRDVARNGHRFISWTYKPGQRLELLVPVEKWTDQIVLPVDAVADEGAETSVFQQNGDHFDRRPVHVKYRDQHNVVIANDGSVYPGDVVALKGAHQMQMALKKKAGGGGDAHAGHVH